MPEYLAPGVYVEEVSFRSKSIEGVPTSTTGFAGMTRSGPIPYTYLDLNGGIAWGPIRTEPRLITSFTEFEHTYGGLDPLLQGGKERVTYLAHAARAFFENGGRRLYVSRVFFPADGTGVATGPTLAVGAGRARWRARWPGSFGNVHIETRLLRTKNVNASFAVPDPRSTWGPQARGARAGTIVEIIPAGGSSANVLSGTGPYNLEPLQTLLLAVDGAVPASMTFTATRAQKAGAGGAFATMTNGLTLDIRVDGGATQTITFTAADITAAAVAARINASLLGGAAVVNGTEVDILSDTRGTSSSLEILAGSTAQVPTGQAVGLGSPGTGNVANIDRVTAAEVAAVLNGLGGAIAAVENNAVRLTSPTAGIASQLQVQATSTAIALGFDTVLHGATGAPPKLNDPPSASTLYVVHVDADGRQRFVNASTPLPGRAVLTSDFLQIITLRAIVTVNPERIDVHDNLGVHQDDTRYIGKILQADDPEDENAAVWLELDTNAADPNVVSAELLLVALRGTGNTGTGTRLTGGTDGSLITAAQLSGKEADPDNPNIKATGLENLGEIDDIAIVAAPDAASLGATETQVATGLLIAHAEKCRYRIAVVDGPENSSMTEIRQFRGQFDSKYAAIYHPWIEILDPTERAAQGAPPSKLLLPPSGFVTGIYARSDIERGVQKAPANEIVRGLTRFEANINKARQEVLNPEGINALRFLEGRGNRVWGARTMSSDPEWKYVNVRRLFIYAEHSIDKGTQWAVFEPNNNRLWANIRQTIEDFLLVLWKDGALLGDKPEDAYFVRCDRTTMTQNDLDNGKLICLIGIAPVKPAEFVIFRIGQWTGDSKV